MYKLQQIDNMDGHRFEYACADILKCNGFKNIEVTKGSGDYGVDIVAEKKGLRYAIQCKCYSHKLNNSPIQEVIAGMSSYNCNAAAVMTNQYFTEPAIILAKRNNVELWDRDKLKRMMSNSVHRLPIDTNKLRNKSMFSKVVLLILLSLFFVLGSLVMILNKELPYSDRIVGGITFFAFSIISAGFSYYYVKKHIQRKKEDSRKKEINIDNTSLLNSIVSPNSNTNEKSIEKPCNFTNSNTHKSYKFDYKKFAQEVNYELQKEDYSENFISNIASTGRYMINFFNFNCIYVKLINIDKHPENNEAIFELRTERNTRIRQVKNELSNLAAHIGVDKIEYIYPTTTKHTFGLKISIP